MMKKNAIVLAVLCAAGVSVWAQQSGGVQVMPVDGGAGAKPASSSAQAQPAQGQNTQVQSAANKLGPNTSAFSDGLKRNGAPITTTAPQFIPNNSEAGVIAPVAPPTVSAYGTPIYYGTGAMVNGQLVTSGTAQAQAPVQYQNQGQQVQAQNLPQGLPAIPTATAQQAMYDSGLSLSADEIRKLKKQIEEQGRAAAEEPTGRPPRAETNSVLVSLTPGSTPPVVRLYMNYPTALVVVDNAGNPWPIENFSGGSKQIEIVRTVEKGPDGASISLTPRTPTGKFTHGGISLNLKDLAIPVSITYVGGQPVVDQRVELRVPRRGPNTSTPTQMSIGPAASTSLLSLLDGVAPHNAKAMKVSGLAQAWDTGNGRMVVRTPLVVISPGYASGMRSADGTNAYEMEKVSELRALDGGKVVSISLDY
jgi:intracellular multiplication protein IcmK